MDAYCDVAGSLHRRDARAKALVFVLLAASASTAAWDRPARLGACALLLGALLLLGRVPPLLVARRSLIVLPFLLLPALSALFVRAPGGEDASPWVRVAMIAGRSWLSAAAVLTLMACTRYPDFLEGARRLGVPRLLVSLAAFLYRYLFLLTDEARRMLLARGRRGGRRAGIREAFRVAGAMVASLFLRAYERSERVHQCMLSRGFDGEALRLDAKPLSAGDWVFLLLFLAAVGGTFLL